MKKPFVYIPPDAKINIENKPMEEIKTKYEKRRVVLRRKNVNQVVKGTYGTLDDSSLQY